VSDEQAPVGSHQSAVGEPAQELAPDWLAADRLKIDPAPAADSRPTTDDHRPTTPSSQLTQVKEELVAWVKTLMSAAVYAVLDCDVPVPQNSLRTFPYKSYRMPFRQ